MSKKETLFTKELKSKLPTRYVPLLVKIINEDETKPAEFSMNAYDVRNVISGNVQALDKVAVVLGACEILIKKQEQLKKRAQKIVA